MIHSKVGNQNTRLNNNAVVLLVRRSSIYDVGKREIFNVAHT